MDNILQKDFRRAISLLNGTPFQNFVTKLFTIKFGKDFTPVKQKWDGGADGILSNDIIIAAYAPTPQKTNLDEFKKKIGKDYKKYKENWKATHPNWEVVYNNEFTSKRIQFLDNLHPNVIKTDINHLIEMIQNLNYPKQRDLAMYLGITMEFIRNDILKQVVEDILRTPSEETQDKYIHPPEDLEEKIRKNYLPSDFDEIKKEHEECYSDISQIPNILKAYDSRENLALKSKVLTKFQRLKGDFKERFNNLHLELSGDHDDLYSYAVRNLLLYYFIICLLGESP